MMLLEEFSENCKNLSVNKKHMIIFLLNLEIIFGDKIGFLKSHCNIIAFQVYLVYLKCFLSLLLFKKFVRLLI